MLKFSVELKEVLDNQCLAAFNIDDFVFWQALVEVVAERKIPCLAQLSEGEAEFFGLANLESLRETFSAREYIFTNLDHGQSEETIEQALNLNYSLVHFDGSDLAWEENCRRTSNLVKMAHQRGILVEGEPQAELTEPRKAAEFYRRTEVDLMAIFVGNKHGMPISGVERLDFDRLRRIRNEVGTKVGLTLHGGSGVAAEDIKKAVSERLVAKINFNTVLRRTYRQVLSASLSQYCGEKVYELVAPVRKALVEKIRELFDLTQV